MGTLHTTSEERTPKAIKQMGAGWGGGGGVRLPIHYNRKIAKKLTKRVVRQGEKKRKEATNPQEGGRTLSVSPINRDNFIREPTQKKSAETLQYNKTHIEAM